MKLAHLGSKGGYGHIEEDQAHVWCARLSCSHGIRRLFALNRNWRELLRRANRVGSGAIVGREALNFAAAHPAWAIFARTV
jgi:hypothetical protein